MSDRPAPNFNTRREAPPRLHPRKVRGGVKLPERPADADPRPDAWASQRLVRLIEAASGPDLAEGLLYARLGQTKSITFDPGAVVAVVQGRADRPYTVRLAFAEFSDDHWHKVVLAISESPAHAARVLARELATSIEDLFAPMGLRLVPLEPTDLQVSCTCKRTWASTPTTDPTTDTPRDQASTPPPPAAPAPRAGAWCKHAACAAYLLADRLAEDPFLIFKLRGLPAQELLDRVRHQRALLSPARGAGLYHGRVAGVSDLEHPPLQASLDHFWDAGPQLRDADGPILPPPVTHPLLRRLGPSPFPQSSFPLVGLLASCYDTISADALRRLADPARDDAPPTPENHDSDETV
ncbi:MAG: hypothetical protein HRU70_02575 [Phycisphaeraceae bacterium]|nr:MAG: hypothetical protein HRU70_02575 [Phycisphaeraceae bacterium]